MLTLFHNYRPCAPEKQAHSRLAFELLFFAISVYFVTDVEEDEVELLIVELTKSIVSIVMFEVDVINVNDILKCSFTIQ